MQILVTGSSGFLGKFLCQALEKQGHAVIKVHSKNANLTSQDALEPFNSFHFDEIYHLAAWTQAGDFCLRFPGEQWINNQQINTTVLNWWVRKQPQARLIAMGTSCSYDPTLPLHEENYLVGKPIESLFTYAMTKRMLLTGLIALNKQFGVNYNYFIPSTLYGPGYHTDGRQLHFIFDLIRKILAGKLHGEPVTLWGNGEQKRELIHVDDFIHLMLSAKEKIKNQWINIGSGEEFSIKQFADALCSITDYDASLIEYDLSKYVGAKSKVLDVSKLKECIQGYEAIPLTEGLRETVHWFKETFFMKDYSKREGSHLQFENHC